MKIIAHVSFNPKTKEIKDFKDAKDFEIKVTKKGVKIQKNNKKL